MLFALTNINFPYCPAQNKKSKGNKNVKILKSFIWFTVELILWGLTAQLDHTITFYSFPIKPLYWETLPVIWLKPYYIKIIYQACSEACAWHVTRYLVLKNLLKPLCRTRLLITRARDETDSLACLDAACGSSPVWCVRVCVYTYLA